MIPGEIICADGEITLNDGRETLTLIVANGGDRPVQVGSHHHFAEANPALDFDRSAARRRVQRRREGGGCDRFVRPRTTLGCCAAA